MRRPWPIHFLAITTDQFINIRAFVTVGKRSSFVNPGPPIRALGLLYSYRFEIKIVGLGADGKCLYKKHFESDSWGTFGFKIPLNEERKKIHTLHVYEVRRNPGLEWCLGVYIPLKVVSPKRIVISDFDKTLVDTRYGTTKEIYASLTQSIKRFPTLNSSVRLLTKYVDQGLHPFILSASPHFYEDAIRDWLYRHHIYTAGIFLKDYRRLFSLVESILTFKDIKVQGVYKLDHLLTILLMTGIPDELVLMGDNFESDPVIYAALVLLLYRKSNPWDLWQFLKNHPSFKTNLKQEGQLLNKLYQLEGLLENQQGHTPPQTKIFIRKRKGEDDMDLGPHFDFAKSFIELYSN